MGKIIIYHDGIQEEVEEDQVKIYNPFPEKEEETDASEYFDLKAHAEGW